MQVPLLQAYCHLSIAPASFLSKMLPPAADKHIQASYVQEALEHQKVQVAISMDKYGTELQQGSLAVLAWQAEMAALHGSTR